LEKLFNVFSVLSIIISCLGLFGLATFAAQQRVKEIGVRRGYNIFCNCFSGCMVGDEPMAPELCLPYQYFVVDIYRCRSCRIADCVDNGELPGNQSRNCKPGKKPANRVGWLCFWKIHLSNDLRRPPCRRWQKPDIP
jgi:hypothetical protein